jgi:hypothetical protein
MKKSIIIRFTQRTLENIQSSFKRLKTKFGAYTISWEKISQHLCWYDGYFKMTLSR